MITSKQLLKNAEKYSSEPAFSFKNTNNEWQTDSWEDFSNYVFLIAKSLVKLGVDANNKISIYSYNRKEWSGIYAATQMVRGVAVGVYHTCSPEEVEWIVGNSESKIVFIGNNPNDNGDPDKMPVNRFMAVLDRMDHVQKVILMNDIQTQAHDKVISWSDFLSLGSDVDISEIHSRIDDINENDTSSLIYTSGTTGNPKGVELTHGNWEFEVNSLNKILQFNQGEKYVSWLPLAHVFGQLVDNHTWIKDALHLHVVDSPLSVVDYAKEVQPHLFIGVPRIYEKIYSNLKSAIESKLILKIGLKIPILSAKKQQENIKKFNNLRKAIESNIKVLESSTRKLSNFQIGT